MLRKNRVIFGVKNQRSADATFPRPPPAPEFPDTMQLEICGGPGLRDDQPFLDS